MHDWQDLIMNMHPARPEYQETAHDIATRTLSRWVPRISPPEFTDERIVEWFRAVAEDGSDAPLPVELPTQDRANAFLDLALQAQDGGTWAGNDKMREWKAAMADPLLELADMVASARASRNKGDDLAYFKLGENLADLPGKLHMALSDAVAAYE